jgi:hypothetical protein
VQDSGILDSGRPGWYHYLATDREIKTWQVSALCPRPGEFTKGHSQEEAWQWCLPSPLLQMQPEKDPEALVQRTGSLEGKCM